MRLTRFRATALLVLVLFGGPLAAHVITHDLHHDENRGTLAWEESGHGTHEHPVLTSAAARVSAALRTVMGRVKGTIVPTVAVQFTSRPRNVICFGAIRIDDDVGLQALLSTFLI
jgi:hypothetical protein